MQNRNFQRSSNKTPVVQQSHQVQSKQMPLTSEHPSMGLQANSQSQNPQGMMQQIAGSQLAKAGGPTQPNARQSQPQPLLANAPQAPSGAA